jgi:Fic family protein
VKLPLSPPELVDLLTKTPPYELVHAMSQQEGGLVHGDYMHWDELRHRPAPEGVQHETWWLAVRMARQGLLKQLPLLDKYNQPMYVAMPEPVLRDLHHIDQDAAGRVSLPGNVVNPADRDDYIFNSLIEEAVTSSQLEGASTTRLIAEEMLRAGRQPRDHSERMIFNNYQAMDWIRSIKDRPLTPKLVLELHQRVTHGTLDNPDDAGRLRQRDDVRVVDNRDGTVLHEPPLAASLAERLERLCAFASGAEGGLSGESQPFVHPVVRSILLHFMIAYDHPFTDGNGRTARALFYWSMARQGYWLMEYLSISRIIKQAPKQYSLAYLHTETDDNDTTYFLIHQLRVIRQAIAALHDYLARKGAEQRGTARLLQTSPTLRGKLNQRQITLLTHALKQPGFDYVIEAHQRSQSVSYATARSDLLSLVELGLLEQTKRGRAFVFIAPDDLRARIELSSKVKV